MTKKIKLVPLGGLGEIGMNCLALESDDEIIVVDCGILFSDLDHLGVDFVIPDFTYLLERKEKLSGFVITHGHEDHIGALPFAVRAGLDVPIYASPFTMELIKEKFRRYEIEENPSLVVYQPGGSMKFKDFVVETIPVNHSIVEAVSFVIQTPVGTVIHTADFKIDSDPYYGQPIDLDEFKRLGKSGVQLLMADSTNVERLRPTLPESKIFQGLNKIFKKSDGLVVVSTFSSNVSRVGQILDLAESLGRKVALSGRSLEDYVRIARSSGYLKNAGKVLIPLDEVGKHPREKVIVLATGCQGEFGAALHRIAYGNHSQVKLQPGDFVIMSSRFIPGNEKAISRVINHLFKQGAEVFYEDFHDIHVSGHAGRDDLEKILKLTRPKFFMPIHGEYRHLVRHRRLAIETGVNKENVLVAENGDVVELSSEGLKVIEHFDETRVLVEGREGNDVSKLLLKNRRQLGESGLVISIVLKNSMDHRVIAEPEVIFRGIVGEESEEKLLETSKRVVQKAVNEYTERLDKGDLSFDLQEEVRIRLRRHLREILGKKPPVLPIVLDV